MYNWTSDLCGHIKRVKLASICQASEVMDSVLFYAQLTLITLALISLQQLALLCYTCTVIILFFSFSCLSIHTASPLLPPLSGGEIQLITQSPLSLAATSSVC